FSRVETPCRCREPSGTVTLWSGSPDLHAAFRVYDKPGPLYTEQTALRGTFGTAGVNRMFDRSPQDNSAEGRRYWSMGPPNAHPLLVRACLVLRTRYSVQSR